MAANSRRCGVLFRNNDGKCCVIRGKPSVSLRSTAPFCAREPLERSRPRKASLPQKGGGAQRRRVSPILREPLRQRGKPSVCFAASSLLRKGAKGRGDLSQASLPKKGGGVRRSPASRTTEGFPRIERKMLQKQGRYPGKPGKTAPTVQMEINTFPRPVPPVRLSRALLRFHPSRRGRAGRGSLPWGPRCRRAACRRARRR